MKIVTPREMQALEMRFMEDKGIGSEVLMDRAADGLVAAAEELCGRGSLRRNHYKYFKQPQHDPNGLSTIIFCGPGANGGDGWAMAHKLGHLCDNIMVITICAPLPGTAAYANYKECLKPEHDVRIVDFANAGLNHCEDAEQLYRHIVGIYGETLMFTTFCVDALFGTGFNRPLDGIYLGMINLMKKLAARGSLVLAADIPSGLNGTTGIDGGACPADMTVTFQFIKYGQLLADGQDACGKLICHDIGISEAYAPPSAPEYLTYDGIRFPRRRHNSHKGTYGHALIIAGSKQYAGAALLCTKAAARSGAGLITSACVSELRPLLQSGAPSAMALEADGGDAFGGDSIPILRAALAGKSAIAIGPGLSRNAAPEVIELALKSGLPAVIDADALNIISEHAELRALLGENHILTPHPGEMARLLGRPCALPQDDAAALARECGCTVLLKGCVTCVANPQGAFMLNPGAPGMACGGSGDVLTGVIAALLAQGYLPTTATIIGALIHGRAGVIAQRHMGAIAMNASDIIDCLPQAFKAAEELRYI